MSHFYQPDDETWEGRMDSYIEEAEKQITTLRAALDQERADAARWRWLCEHHPDVLAQISPAPKGLVVRLSGRGDGGNDG